MITLLDERVAVIVGADSEIGVAVAREIAKYGADVALTYHAHPDRAVAVQKTIEAFGRRTLLAPLDLQHPLSIQTTFKEVVSTFGRLDILVNCADITLPRPFLDIAVDDWDSVINVNLRGLFLCMQCAAREMITCGARGRIITISLVDGMMTGRYHSSYAASKGGVNLLTESVALELAEHNITVNTIAPSQRICERELTEYYQQALAGEIFPVQRLLSPEYTARLAVYLASDKASSITGDMMLVDPNAQLFTEEIPC